MLHKTVILANLQVFCPTRGAEMNKVAGQLRNLFYAYSLPWSQGNLGRVIPKCDYDEFYKEFTRLEKAFRSFDCEFLEVTLTVLPFPAPFKYEAIFSTEQLLQAPAVVSEEIGYRFHKRVYMLRDSLEQEKRFYASLLDGLGKIINTGMYLRKSIDPKLVTRMKSARSDILCYSAEDIRRSASLREDIINICGALL